MSLHVRVLKTRYLLNNSCGLSIVRLEMGWKVETNKRHILDTSTMNIQNCNFLASFGDVRVYKIKNTL